MEIHEDDRRILFDYASGTFKSAKAVIIKKTMMVGAHKHYRKDEEFLLLQGKFLEINIGGEIKYDIKAPYYFAVKKGVYHSFVCEKNSILLGVATETFDEKDEIK